MYRRLTPTVRGLLVGVVLGVGLAYASGLLRMRQLERRWWPNREVTRMANRDLRRVFPDARILDAGVVAPSLKALQEGTNGTFDVEISILRECSVRTFSLRYDFKSGHAIPKSNSELETAVAKGSISTRGCGQRVAPSEIPLRVTP